VQQQLPGARSIDACVGNRLKTEFSAINAPKKQQLPAFVVLPGPWPLVQPARAFLGYAWAWPLDLLRYIQQ
jgi:hypothetical protein